MTPAAAAKKNPVFDPNAFLGTVSQGQKAVFFAKKQAIFAQGEVADAVFYVQEGKVRLTVVSHNGREATVGILGDGDFCGEGCLAGQALRMGSAIAMTECTVLRIDKTAMMEALHREHKFSDLFVAYLLARNIQRKEAGSDSFAAGSLWQRRQARNCDPQDQSGNAGRDGGHNPFTGELFHEPVQNLGLR